eukprot:Pgem_evm1s13308
MFLGSVVSEKSIRWISKLLENCNNYKEMVLKRSSSNKIESQSSLIQLCNQSKVNILSDTELTKWQKSIKQDLENSKM